MTDTAPPCSTTLVDAGTHRPPEPPQLPEYGYLAAFLFGSAMTLLAASGGVAIQRIIAGRLRPAVQMLALPTCEERVEECPGTGGAR